MTKDKNITENSSIDQSTNNADSTSKNESIKQEVVNNDNPIESSSINQSINEIFTITENLSILQENIKNYAGASKKLEDVTNSLIQLTNSLLKMQEVLPVIVKKMENSEEKLEKSLLSVDKLTDSFPLLISTIESLDFTKSLNDNRKIFDANLKLLEKIQTELFKTLDKQSISINAIHEELIINKDRNKTTVKSISNIHNEINEIKDDINIIKKTTQLINQNLSKKKGFFS